MDTIPTDLAPLPAARTAIARLSVQEKAQLMRELAQEIAQAAASTAPTSQQPRRGDPRAVVAAVLAMGPWEGGDLEERLQEVYAARAPMRFEKGDWRKSMDSEHLHRHWMEDPDYHKAYEDQEAEFRMLDGRETIKLGDIALTAEQAHILLHWLAQQVSQQRFARQRQMAGAAYDAHVAQMNDDCTTVSDTSLPF